MYKSYIYVIGEVGVLAVFEGVLEESVIIHQIQSTLLPCKIIKNLSLKHIFAIKECIGWR